MKPSYDGADLALKKVTKRQLRKGLLFQIIALEISLKSQVQEQLH